MSVCLRVAADRVLLLLLLRGLRLEVRAPLKLIAPFSIFHRPGCFAVCADARSSSSDPSYDSDQTKQSF